MEYLTKFYNHFNHFILKSSKVIYYVYARLVFMNEIMFSNKYILT